MFASNSHSSQLPTFLPLPPFRTSASSAFASTPGGVPSIPATVLHMYTVDCLFLPDCKLLCFVFIIHSLPLPQSPYFGKVQPSSAAKQPIPRSQSMIFLGGFLTSKWERNTTSSTPTASICASMLLQNLGPNLMSCQIGWRFPFSVLRAKKKAAERL